MSFKLLNPIDGSVAGVYKSGEELDLEASATMYIEPLSTCLIQHRVTIAGIKGHVLLCRIPGVFLTHTLFVDNGPVDNGVVTTAVFNFGTERVRIEKGTAVSRLIAI